MNVSFPKLYDVAKPYFLAEITPEFPSLIFSFLKSKHKLNKKYFWEGLKLAEYHTTVVEKLS